MRKSAFSRCCMSFPVVQALLLCLFCAFVRLCMHVLVSLNPLGIFCPSINWLVLYGSLRLSYELLVSSKFNNLLLILYLVFDTAARSMNMEAVFLHVLADFLGSVIVVTSALVIWLVPGDPKEPRNQWKLYIDPCMRLVHPLFPLLD